MTLDFIFLDVSGLTCRYLNVKILNYLFSKKHYIADL